MSKEVDNYLALRRQLGNKLLNDAGLLHKFAVFLIDNDSPCITVELALQFAMQNPNSSPQQWARRLSMIRQFAIHLSATHPDTQIPPPHLLPCHYSRCKPYIYSSEEITKILQTCLKINNKDSLRVYSYYIILGLLAVTGMRPCEVLSLNCDCIDFEAGIISIHESKFLKSRRIPIHKTTLSELKQYAMHRNKQFGDFQPLAFFVDNRGSRIMISALRKAFTKICILIGIRSQKDRPVPRLMDFRHSVAIRTLTEWNQDEINIEAVMPLLSRYLGHKNPLSTYWYLTGIPELLSGIKEKMEDYHEIY
jgi:integrase